MLFITIREYLSMYMNSLHKSLFHHSIFICILYSLYIYSALSYTYLATLAETPMDYEAVDTILLFTACEIRACFNVGIVDDNIAELTERFSVKLNRTDGLDERITLDPIVAEVEIVDNDGEWMNNVIFLIRMQDPC